MTEVQKVLAHGPTTKYARRYHFAIPFPDAQPDYVLDMKQGWGDPRMWFGGGPYDRFAHILAGLLAERYVTQACVREYNICLNIKEVRPALMQERWAAIDRRVTELAGEKFSVYSQSFLQRTRHYPEVPIAFGEYPWETAIGPSPQQSLELELPAEFGSLHVIDYWKRGLGEIGKISLRSAKRASHAQLLLIEQLQRVHGLSRFGFGYKGLSCNIGLAFDLEEVKFAIEHAIGQAQLALPRTLQPA
jgi:hypothetical protein